MLLRCSQNVWRSYKRQLTCFSAIASSGCYNQQVCVCVRACVCVWVFSAFKCLIGTKHAAWAFKVIITPVMQCYYMNEPCIYSHISSYSIKVIHSHLSLYCNNYTLTIVHGFRPESLTLAKNIISLERASQGEQNGANFSFLAPSIWE